MTIKIQPNKQEQFASLDLSGRFSELSATPTWWSRTHDFLSGLVRDLSSGGMIDLKKQAQVEHLIETHDKFMETNFPEALATIKGLLHDVYGQRVKDKIDVILNGGQRIEELGGARTCAYFCESDMTEVVVCGNDDRMVVRASRHSSGKSIFDGSFSDQLFEYNVLNHNGRMMTRCEPSADNFARIDQILDTAVLSMRVTELGRLRNISIADLSGNLTEPMPFEDKAAGSRYSALNADIGLATDVNLMRTQLSLETRQAIIRLIGLDQLMAIANVSHDHPPNMTGGQMKQAGIFDREARDLQTLTDAVNKVLGCKRPWFIGYASEFASALLELDAATSY